MKHFFQIFLHDPGEDFVKDDQISLNGLTAQGKLLGLALADAEGGIGGGALLQHPQHGFGSGGLSQFLQLVQRFLAFDAYQDRPLMIFLQFFLLGQIGRVGLLDMIQPVLLGQTAGGQQLRQHIPGGGMLIQKRALGAGRLALRVHAHGAHGVKTHGQKGAQVNVAELARGAGVGMDAADHAQPPLAAAKAQVGQVDGVRPADENIGDLAVTGDVQGHLPVEGGRPAAQGGQHFLWEKNIRLQLEVV